MEIRKGDMSTITTILIVEDDTDIGEILLQTIRDETTYQALLATDGFQALKIVRNIVPQLFLLDYRLPGMDGLELYDHLHTMPELERVPAILMSADLRWRDIEERHLKAIKKPFELDSLLQLIEETLNS